MKLAKPICPTCGELVCSYDETVAATAGLTYDEDAGEFEAGESEPAWDCTEPVTDDKGELTLNCRHGHSWQSAELPDDAVQVIPDAWSVTNSEAAEREGWDVFNEDTKPEIQRVDEADEFKNDKAALQFVKGRAKRGSELHEKALRICGVPS